MKDIKIKTEPFEFLTLKNVQIHKKVNEHSTASISGYIEETVEDNYIHKALAEVQIKIELLDEEENSVVLFYGVVVSFSIEVSGKLKLLTIELISNTYLMDIEWHTRIFQDNNLKYSSILQEISSSYSQCSYIYKEKKDESINKLLVQYQETDWQFLKRMMSRVHSYLIPVDINEGIKYYVGKKSLEQKKCIEDGEYYLRKEIDTYRKKLAYGLNDIIESNEIGVIFEEREWYEIGDKVTFNGTPFYIYEITSQYKGKEMVHTYYCKAEEGFCTTCSNHPNISGVSFEAVVEDIKDDLVKVKVLIDENEQGKIEKWFSYSTVYSSPDGTGWYCMPEKGDRVRLYFPSSIEEEAYVISAVHLKSENSTERQNPDNKSLKNKYGKEILFTPDSLILTNNNGMSISLLDKEGIIIESDKSITICADADIEIASNKETVTVLASEEVNISQGSTSLVIDDNIQFKGGKLKME